MKSAAAVVLALLAVLVVTATLGAARDPRLEKVSLQAADTRRAERALIRLSDLVSGWKGGLVHSSGDGDVPECPWEDYSAFTVTGQAVSTFTQAAALLNSSVQIFSSGAHARADFAMATRPGTARCSGEGFKRILGASGSLISARLISAPKAGERAVAYRYVLRRGAIRVYIEEAWVLRDRAIAVVTTISPGARIGVAGMAWRIDERLAASRP